MALLIRPQGGWVSCMQRMVAPCAEKNKLEDEGYENKKCKAAQTPLLCKQKIH
jgi:hypothetical protein